MHVYVVPEARVFKYVNGDARARAAAQAYAVSIGVPENQVDWGERDVQRQSGDGYRCGRAWYGAQHRADAGA